MKSLKHNFTWLQTLLFACLVFGPMSCANTQQQISLEQIESKPYSGVVKDKLELVVISDSDKFREIYSKIRSLDLAKPSPPEIDFEQYRILIAFMGRKPTAGYYIDFHPAVLQRDNEIEVKVTLHAPQRGAELAQVITNPYAIAKIAIGSYESAKFVDGENEVIGVVKINQGI